jgi:hypothetical protein
MTTQTHIMTNAENNFDKLDQMLQAHFKTSPVKDGEHIRYYFIATGKKDAQLTLNSFSSFRTRKPAQYMCNLPNDAERAFEKVAKLVDKSQCVMLDRTPENERQKSFKVLRFGKYKDQHIEQVIEQDIDYAVWLFEQAKSKYTNLRHKYQSLVDSGYEREAMNQARRDGNWDCVETKLDRCLLQEYAVQLREASEKRREAFRAKKQEERDTQMQDVEKIADGRQELTLTIIKRKSYEWGVKYLCEDQQKRRFFGALPSSIEYGTVNTDTLEKHKIAFTIKATVTAKEDHFAFMKRPHIKEAELDRLEEICYDAQYPEKSFTEYKEEEEASNRKFELVQIITKGKEYRDKYTVEELKEMFIELVKIDASVAELHDKFLRIIEEERVS